MRKQEFDFKIFFLQGFCKFKRQMKTHVEKERTVYTVHIYKIGII